MNAIISFLLGISSSLIATILYIKFSNVSIALPFLRGIRFIPPNREKYTREISNLIRVNENRFIFKGFTGFDLFSADKIKRALEETRTDTWQNLFFIFTDCQKLEFQVELHTEYTKERLIHLQNNVLDFIRTSVLKDNQSVLSTVRKGICFTTTESNFFNLLILDELMFVFFRGFSKQKGAKSQIILRIDLNKCPKKVYHFISAIEKFYTSKFDAEVKSNTKIRQKTSNK